MRRDVEISLARKNRQRAVAAGEAQVRTMPYSADSDTTECKHHEEQASRYLRYGTMPAIDCLYVFTSVGAAQHRYTHDKTSCIDENAT
eukprot:6176421-Pleurochrysis_carterae.AAC.2